MMKFLRSQSQVVLVIFLGVMGLGFLFYGNAGSLLNPGAHGSNDYGRIDGADLSVAELYGAVRNTRYWLTINGHGQQLNQPGAKAMLAQEAWRQLLLLHEADRLHIQISDQELIDYIRKQPIFQKDGVYNPDAYQAAMAQMQVMLHVASDGGVDPLATTKSTFIEVIRNNLRTNAVSGALFSTVRSSVQDVGSKYEMFYGPATVSFITFDSKAFAAAAQVTPEEIAAEYKAHPLNPDYRTKEKRNIDYVIFPLSPDDAKLTGKDKAAALEALGEKALEFALAFQPEPTATSAPPPPPDFIAEAKKRGLTPVTTGFFSADTPPAGLPPSPSFNSAAFALTKDNVYSKVVEMDNGVAVLHLAEIQPSDLLPLEQVKDGIVKELGRVKGAEAQQAAAEKASEGLKAAVAKGTDFKTAAASLNLKVETMPAFVPMKVPGTDARLQTIAYVVSTLNPGQVSDAVPIQSDDSMIIVNLDGRAKAEPAGLPDFAQHFGEQQNQQLRSMVYLDWANWASKRPGTHKPPDLDAYGAVE